VEPLRGGTASPPPLVLRITYEIKPGIFDEKHGIAALLIKNSGFYFIFNPNQDDYGYDFSGSRGERKGDVNGCAFVISAGNQEFALINFRDLLSNF